MPWKRPRGANDYWQDQPGLYLNPLESKQRKPALNFPDGLKVTFTSIEAAAWQAH